eukprot:SAG31_NODE_467_length_15267_cov_13.792919_20_plen_44_part_00
MHADSQATALGAEYQPNYMERVVVPMMAAAAEAEAEGEPETVS